MRENLKVTSRYGDEYHFMPIDEDGKKYIFKCGDYYRVGFDNPDDVEYAFVDPSGGPFISPGYKIDDNHIVKSISKHQKGLLIEFE